MQRVFAVVLSLISPGAGHFLLGERVRGLIAAIVGGVLLLALPLAIGPLLWASLAVRVLAIGDVLVGVRPIRPASVAGAAIAGAVAPVGLALLWAFALSLYKIPASSMEPTLHIGQKVVVNRLAYVFDEPARGDVIVFDNPCSSKKFNKRVIGLAGDTVEVRCNQLYVNGAAVPTELVESACSYDDFDDSEQRWSRETCSRYRESLGGVSYSTLQDAELPDAVRTADPHDFPEIAGPLDRMVRAVVPSCGTDDPRHQGAALGTIERSVAEPASECAPQVHYVVPAGSVFVLGDHRQNSSDSRVWGPVPLGAITGKVVLVLGSGGR